MIGSRRSGEIRYAFATGSIKSELAFIFGCDVCDVAYDPEGWRISIGDNIDDFLFKFGDVVVRDIDNELYIYPSESFINLYTRE